MDKKLNVGMYVISPDLKARIEKAAKAEDRSASSLVRLILTEWLKTHEKNSSSPENARAEKPDTRGGAGALGNIGPG